MTKKRRSSLDLRFHHGTCWISMSILQESERNNRDRVRKKNVGGVKTTGILGLVVDRKQCSGIRLRACVMRKFLTHGMGRATTDRGSDTFLSINLLCQGNGINDSKTINHYTGNYIYVLSNCHVAFEAEYQYYFANGCESLSVSLSLSLSLSLTPTLTHKCCLNEEISKQHQNARRPARRM